MDIQLSSILKKLPLSDKERDYLLTYLSVDRASTPAPAGAQTTNVYQSLPVEEVRAIVINYLKSIPRLSHITYNAGDIVAGRFIAPALLATSVEPTDAGFTGSFVSGDGETFGSVVYNMGGASAGVLKWGAKQSDGTLIAGAGVVTLDDDGTTIVVSTAEADLNAYKFASVADVFGGMYGFDSGTNRQVSINAINDVSDVATIVLNTSGSQGIINLVASSTGAGPQIILRAVGTTYTIEVNPGGRDVDTTIQGNTNAYVFVLDGGLDKLTSLVWDGWGKVTGTWTRTGDHTFTVSGDVTAAYRKGAKVRYKDGGSYEYGVIVSSSYSSPNTTVTLIANTDYAMAAATITDTHLSYIENPEGFPAKFNYTSTIAYAGGTTNPTSVTVNTAYWRVFNSEFYLTIKATLVRGTGNRLYTAFSIPVTAAAISPIPGMDTITAAGLSAATACYFETTNATYQRLMANNGIYYINGSCTF